MTPSFKNTIHSRLINFLIFCTFYKNIQQKGLFKIFIFWWEGKRKMGISTSNHNILLNNPCNNIFLFFCNLGICVNLSILCTHSWSNTFLHKKCNKFIFSSLFCYLHFVWLPIMNFLLNSKVYFNNEKYNNSHTTIYGYFSPYFPRTQLTVC